MSQDVAAKYPFHAIIFDYLVSKRTGILTFEPGTRKLFFDAGQLVFANSDEPSEHFASILVESGTFSQEQLDQAKEESGPGKSLGRQLKTMGLATSQQLAHALKQQITCIVDAALSQGAGDCQSVENPLPARVPKLKIQTLGLIIKSIFKMDSETFSIPIQLDQPLFKTAIGDLNISKIAIPPAYLELFNFLRENDSFSPDTLQEIAKLDGTQLKKMIYVLHQLGVIAFQRDSSSVQEPLAEITDDGTYHDDTLGEDALATLLPTTIPPKTDLNAASNPQNAIRQINLPSFAKGPTDTQVPTLRVQDPRKQESPLELEETVRQFRPETLLSPEDLAPAAPASPIPELEEALTLDQDLETISRELDPIDLVEFSEEADTGSQPSTSEELDASAIPMLSSPIENLQDALEQIQPETEPPALDASLQELSQISSFDEQPDFEDEALKEETKAELQSLLNTPGIDDTDREQEFEKAVYLNPSDPTYDTEPALPRTEFNDELVIEETQTLPTNFQSEIPDLVIPENETKPNPTVIMPDANQDDAIYIDPKPKTSYRSFFKYAALLLLLAAIGLLGYRFFQNKKPSDPTPEGIETQASNTANEALPEAVNDDALLQDGSDTTSNDELTDTFDSNADVIQEAPDPEQESLTGETATGPDDPESGSPSLQQEDQIVELATSTETTDEPISSERDDDLPLPKPVPPTSATTPSNESQPFQDHLEASGNHFTNLQATHSLVIMVACQADTVDKAMTRFASEEVYLFPRMVQGNPCWMITWGAFKSHSEAVNARSNFPQELRQGNDPVWIIKLDP